MKERGITLIALIITIIILIILAAVSIRIIYKNSMINIEKTPEGGEDYGKRKYLKSGYRPRRLYPPNKL